MSQRLADCLADVCKWWNEHKRDPMAIEKRLDLHAVMLDELVHLHLQALEDIHDLEGKPKESLGRRIWTTQGMTFSGSVKKFG